MGRRLHLWFLLLVLGCVTPAAALANSEGSTDELRLTTTKTGASTGVFATEVFNARYPNGQLKPLRHSLIAFPKGTTFDVAATDTCAATDADFKSQGMSACPASSKVGFGKTTVATTGVPVEASPPPLDVTAFARKDGSILVFSFGGVYLSSQIITAHGRFQTTSTNPNCVVVVETPNCQHGEFTPRSLTVTYPARSRVVNGRRHNLITTPRTCPASRRWSFGDTHTFADGSKDVFVNHPRCVPNKKKKKKKKRGSSVRHRADRDDRDDRDDD
jgi:hypothetical protein